jgi:hypothetical protein
MGLDTLVGRIWMDGGPEVRYDIGASAGNFARSIASPEWSKRQTFSGKSVTVTMKKDGGLVVTFDEGRANFVVAGLRGQEDLTDVLLMLLAYEPPKR